MNKRHVPQRRDSDEVETLFNLYLSVCNQALTNHKHSQPFQQIIARARTVAESRPFELAIYDDLPKGAYTVRFQNDQLIKAGAPINVHQSWRLHLSYLMRIAANPERYIQEPNALELEWLTSRFGL